LLRAKEAKEICQAEKVFNKLVTLKRDAERITQMAEFNNDLKTALSGIREQIRILETLSKITGQIPRPQIEMTINYLSLSKIHTRLGRKIDNMENINGIDR
jgi:hypothetical protein